MRLIALVALTMVAFAANSVLNRAALAGGGMGAVAFGAIRLVAGAGMLALICGLWRGGLPLRGSRGARGRAAGVGALLLYLFGFSYAYDALDAGLGALILFGMVQITMFAGGLRAGDRPPPRRWIGAALALGGLVWLLWPGGPTELSLVHSLAMALAGVGWGLYSLIGRGATDALGETGANFVIAAALVALPGLWLGQIGAGAAGHRAIGLAIVCGAVTSGLGYALWYTLLPRLQASVAAVAQLTVPVIAMAGGMVFLGEALSLRFVLASVLVLGGVGLSVLARGR